jgi:hypothetical protein
MLPKTRDKVELQRRVRQVIDQLQPFISQRKLELLIGLSQGYLSRLRWGDSPPSAILVCTLALLAKDPKGRLPELKGYWADSEPASEDSLDQDGREETVQPLQVSTATKELVQPIGRLP